MQIDHIGYAVKNIDKALETFSVLGYEFGEVIEDSARNVHLAFGEKDGYMIELISPIKRNEASPVDTILKKNGSIPYHICYVSEDLEADAENLITNGFKVLIPAEDAIAFKNKRVVFLYNPAVGLIEIVEKYE